MTINRESPFQAQKMQAYGMLFDEFALMTRVINQRQQNSSTASKNSRDIDYENAAVYSQRIEISQEDKPFVLGDAHNKPESQALFEKHLQDKHQLGEEYFPDGEEVNKNKLAHHVKLIFLGDFFHRGRQEDCDLDFLLHILTLKAHNLSQVFLCKGNHEDIRMCSPTSYPSETMQAIQEIPFLQKSLENLFQVIPDMLVSCKETGASFLGIHGLPEPDLPSWLPEWLQSHTSHFILTKGTPITLSESLRKHLEMVLEQAKRFFFSREELVALLPSLETFLSQSHATHFIVPPPSQTSSLKAPLPRELVEQIWPLLYLDTLYHKPYQILPGQTEPLSIALQRQRDESTPMSSWGRLGEIYKHNFDTYQETGPFCSTSTLLAIKMTLSLLGIYLKLVIRGHDHILSFNNFVLTLPASPEPGSNEEQAILQMKTVSPNPLEWNFRLLTRSSSETQFTRGHHFRLKTFSHQIPRSYSPSGFSPSEGEENQPPYTQSEPSLLLRTSATQSISPESPITTTTTTTTSSPTSPIHHQQEEVTTQTTPTASPEPLPEAAPSQVGDTTASFPLSPSLPETPVTPPSEIPPSFEDPNTYPTFSVPPEFHPALQPHLFPLQDTTESLSSPPYLPIPEEETPSPQGYAAPSPSEAADRPHSPPAESFFEELLHQENSLFSTSSPTTPPPSSNVNPNPSPTSIRSSEAFKPFTRKKPKSHLSEVYTYESPKAPYRTLEES